ncbi:hypothetical protein [Celeribacter indicus]|uniref:Uncharacterized protein n=1 Tax=Celeribacter indicus TaxID=1208324 RepID=A0A0B5E509_9RHOB|nr:hypothetical protein [Celeribacter indicus]AJE48091.1 hypothetical protein P73_3376 [Celeribacter indicus]SDW32392.1 hypothetical protein SAMN05443573_102372 [Celeribacter indicus]
MGRRGWHIVETEGALRLARRHPARFDFAATTVLPGGAELSRRRIAHQVRQDMWRALRDLRGFSPVVEVVPRDGGMKITAGGSVAGRFPKDASTARVAALLEAPDLRARWVAFARRR